MKVTRTRFSFVILLGLSLFAHPVSGQDEGEAGHMHGPDGRHLAVAGTFGASFGKSILSHHDLMITDTRKPGKDGEGEVVLGCDVHSVVYRKGDRQKPVHKEHNAFEPENGVYGSHMMYKEPGDYVIVEDVTFPDGSRTTLEFPIWVPGSTSAAAHADHKTNPVWTVMGVIGGLLLLAGAFVLGRRSGKRTAATLTTLSLLTAMLFPLSGNAQEEEGEAGHMHGPDGRHIAVANTFSKGTVPLKAYPTADLKEAAVQTQGNYRFRLSIENEELKTDPDVVTLAPDAVKTLGLTVAEAKESGAAGGLITTGRVQPNPDRAVNINARVGGRVVRVGLTQGDTIQPGHLVAVLDSPEVAEAQSALVRNRSEAQQAQAALSRAKAQMQETQAELERMMIDAENARGKATNTQKTLTRQKELAASGAFAQEPIEAARSAQATAEGELRLAKVALANLEAQGRRLEEGARAGVVARRELEAAQTAVAQGQTRVSTAEQQFEIAKAARAREERIGQQGLRNAREVQQAEADLDAALLSARSVQARRTRVREEEAAVRRAQTAVTAALNRLTLLGAAVSGGSQVTITAPIGGAVETRPVNFGEVVAAGQTLATVLNTYTVWVESDVFEKDLNRIRVGQRVTIAADARPGRTFAGTISYISGEVHPETRAVRVRTVVRNPDELLKPNMFVKVSITTRGAETAVSIPLEAVQEDGGKQIIFLEESPGNYRRRAITPEAVLGDSVIIGTGLMAGEKVVTKGSYQLLAKINGS
jgi:multidrug efflux pump subunit AcrA (membrane-fusion protein)